MTPTASWNPPPSAESLAPSWVLLPWHVVVAGCGLLAAATILATLRFLRNRRQPRAGAAPREVALQNALAALAALPENAPPAEVSSILRTYLFCGLEDPALFETQEEFDARDPVLAALPNPQRASLAAFLRRLNELKYAPTAHAEANLAADARALLLPLQSQPKA